MITPETLELWAQDAEEGDSVELNEKELRQLAEQAKLLIMWTQHHCPEWDFALIDCTMPEFDACICCH